MLNLLYIMIMINALRACSIFITIIYIPAKLTK